MKYDFDTLTSREGTYAVKWDIKPGELPMWIADMDFRTAPEVIDALQHRLDNGIFGYTDVPDEWYNAYIGWWQKRHNFTFEKEWMMFCTGIVPAISSTVRKLTTPNEGVAVLTPCYNIFFNSIINNGCRPVECPLVYSDGTYSIDFEALESALSDPQVSLMILCNPHNPVGKIWSREDLAKVGALCKKYNVAVISDEIHCDIAAPGKGYIPFASVNDDCRDISITCVSPTKVFNIAGLQTAAIVVPNKFLRHKVCRAINTDEVAEPNAFAVDAAIAAFTRGGDWVNELNEYIQANRELVAGYVAANTSAIKLVDSEATYLLWLDISKTGYNGKELAEIIRNKTGLYLSAGNAYGKGGENFLRMNIACPRSMVEDGLTRLEKAINNL